MSNIKPTAKSIIIDAIDEQIRQYEELIGQLEQEKKHYIDSNPIIPEVKKINKTTISPGQQVIMLKSTFLRLVEALAQMPDLFTRIQIKAGAELDARVLLVSPEHINVLLL
ncbi:MAG: hypothetical protein NTV89_16160 [Proteobacteria bacterium]|nr:hypothetical protein [Pseudomonadota bacterium]